MANFTIVCRDTKRIVQFEVPDEKLGTPEAVERYVVPAFDRLEFDVIKLRKPVATGDSQETANARATEHLGALLNAINALDYTQADCHPLPTLVGLNSLPCPPGLIEAIKAAAKAHGLEVTEAKQ